MDDVLSTITPVLIILKILGVVPLNSFSKKPSKVFINYFFAVISLIFWSYDLKVQFSTVELLAYNDAPIFIAGVRLRAFMPFVLLVLTICANNLLRERFRSNC